MSCSVYLYLSVSRHFSFWCGWISRKTDKNGFVITFSMLKFNFNITKYLAKCRYIFSRLNNNISLFLDTFHADVDELTDKQKKMGLYINFVWASHCILTASYNYLKHMDYFLIFLFVDYFHDDVNQLSEKEKNLGL